MNEMLQALITRRSIRKFAEKDVPDTMIQTLLEAAMNAPSACNQQPWRFIVLRDREVKAKLAEMHDGLEPLKAAPVVILVCGDPSSAKLDFYWQTDCAAATQNLLLAAHVLGLGSVWLGVDPRDKEDSASIRSLLNLPENLKPFAMVPVGFSTENKDTQSRYNKEYVVYSA
ncbi:MAG: nitroreductase family protein [Clostridia bacterium]|nr:nitroreductase family protein [Clostridia bacterium]